MKEFFERANAETLSHRDLRMILDALPTPLSWATVPDGCIRFANRAFETLFGYPQGAFPTVDDWLEQTYVRVEDQQIARVRWAKLWGTSSAGISEIEPFEIEIRCLNGAIRTVQHRGILLHEINIGIATFEDISDRKLAEEALYRVACEDMLTGLPNRRVLQNQWTNHVAPINAASSVSALLLIDLDGFKSINDRFGHDAGDQVLVAVANRLRESLRKDDLICRLGGDEFVVLVHEIAGHDHVTQVCSRIERALTRPIQAAGRSVTVGTSIGASLFPQDGRDLPDLIKRADEALYRVKAAGKGGWQWFATPAA